MTRSLALPKAFIRLASISNVDHPFHLFRTVYKRSFSVVDQTFVYFIKRLANCLVVLHVY